MTIPSAQPASAGLRPSIARATEAVDELIMSPSAGRPLDPVTRTRIALRVAMMNRTDGLTARFAARLVELGDHVGVAMVSDPARWTEAGPRGAAVLEIAEQMAIDPGDVDQADLTQLRDCGVTDAEVVAIAQVVAYVSYRARLDQGLAAMVGRTSGGGAPVDDPPTLRALGPDATAFPVLVWRPWVEPLPQPERSAGADTRTPARWSPFYRTLLHEPDVLAARTELYNLIMTGDGSLDRADREFVALATSLVTGCRYCACVHGRRQVQLSGDPITAVRFAASGPRAIPDDHHRMLWTVAAHLALTPAAFGRADVDLMVGQGLEAGAMADLIAVAAMFAWANRLMMTLGEPQDGDRP